jgi:D-aminoacyl-tRNA deacylase
MTNVLKNFLTILFMLSRYTNSIRKPMRSLLVATRLDPASLNIYQSLIRYPIWKDLSENSDDAENSIFLSRNRCGDSVYLWLQSSPLLALDFPDLKFRDLSESHTSFNIDDILFLSKHKAASGRKSLTVHPIGIPWLSDPSTYGGRAGKCVPPSPRIASLYRSLLLETTNAGLKEKYEVTMEATHHGPFAELPCCFVEIGSTESDWSEEDAGEIWAKVIIKHFGLVPLDSEDLDKENVSALEDAETTIDSEAQSHLENANFQADPISYVVVLIGGGHYVPKLNDIVRVQIIFQTLKVIS